MLILEISEARPKFRDIYNITMPQMATGLCLTYYIGIHGAHCKAVLNYVEQLITPLYAHQGNVLDI